MAGKVGASQPSAPYDFEVVDAEDMPMTSNQTRYPWIDPLTLKLKHRIGRGPFGDVWLANVHNSTADFDQYHEVAVKMLHPIKESHMQELINKFEDVFLKCHGLNGVCWLHGISVISNKVCIVMKFYEGSVGDKMDRLKGGGLPLSDVLRFGTELAQGVHQLHSIGNLLLNIKPHNFLLNDVRKQAVIGDFGIPLLLHGIPLPDSHMELRLGTPNYMAPEQWQPEVRGPISFETDSWGFGCSVVEMVTGEQPWRGKSVAEMYHSVVIKQEKPHLPDGLPPVVENVLRGCFEYDLRNRPLIADVLHAFKSAQEIARGGISLMASGNRITAEKSNFGDYKEWFLSKDRLQMGDTVRSRKTLNSCKPENMNIPEGSVVGFDSDTNQNGYVIVRVHGMHDPIRVNSSTLERVTSGLAAGGWVRVKVEDKKHSPVGILHSIERDGSVCVGFIGMATLWRGNSSDLQMAEPYCVGQFVRIKANVINPRFDWPTKGGGEWAAGRIIQILPNGCLIINFPGRFPGRLHVFGDSCKRFLADPYEVQVVRFNTCPGVVKKYQHLEDFHWTVRPLVIALGLFTAMKFGLFIGRGFGKSKKKNLKNINGSVEGDAQHQGQQTGGKKASMFSFR